MLRILYNSPEFTNWAKVLRLLQETVLLAFEINSLVVHVFLKSRSKCLYLEKWRFLRLVAVAVLRAP
jgi:hypothetical protein